MARKKGEGRRKVDMVLIKSENNRRVTFSKRRQGLFQKASELAVLCGLEIGIIVFSLMEKVYTFGSPSVEVIFNRFTKKTSKPTDFVSECASAYRDARVQNLAEEYNSAEERLAVVKERGKMLDGQISNICQMSSREYIDILIRQDNQKLRENFNILKEKLKQKVDYGKWKSSSQSSLPCKELTSFTDGDTESNSKSESSSLRCRDFNSFEDEETESNRKSESASQSSQPCKELNLFKDEETESEIQGDKEALPIPRDWLKL